MNAAAANKGIFSRAVNAVTGAASAVLETVGLKNAPAPSYASYGGRRAASRRAAARRRTARRSGRRMTRRSRRRV